MPVATSSAMPIARSSRGRRRGSTCTTLTAALLLTALLARPASAAPSPVFSDGFESGTLAGYRQVTHSGVQSQYAHSGRWAWRATNPNGYPSYAYHLLPSSYRQVVVDAQVLLVSHSSTVKLFGVRSRGGSRSVDVYVDQRNRVSVRNNIGAVTTYSTTTMATGGWHRLTLSATIGNGTGTVAVTLDGVTVPRLTLTGQNLGTLPFDELRLGDLATAAVFDIAVDDVTVSGSA